jgi:hypothetical protein
MKLIPDWRQALRFNSVQVALLLALLSSIQADVLPLLRPIVSERWWPIVTAGLALAIVLLRLRAQPELDTPEEPRP